MITIFDVAKLSDAYAVADPKHVWIDGKRVLVYTGEDIPQQPVEQKDDLTLIKEKVAALETKVAVLEKR